MNEPSALTSFRRQQEEKRNSANKGSLSDVVEATELVAETVETQGGRQVSAHDLTTDAVHGTTSAVQEGTEATELVAETVENQGNAVSETIKDSNKKLIGKLAEFADMLNSKLSPSQVSNLPAVQSTTVAVLEDKIQDPIDEDILKEAITKLLPPPPEEPDADFFPNQPPPEPEREKEKPDHEEQKKDEEDKKERKETGKKLLGAVSGGFKATYGLLNTISATLFRYTITAAANMIKWAGILFAIVFAIDMIQVHFKHWRKVFEQSLDELNAQVGEWAPILQDIFDTANEIRDYWTKGQYGNLVQALVVGIGKTLIDLGHLIMFGIGKAIAGMLRAIPGMGDTADKVEGRAVSTYSQMTGYVPDEDEKAKAIKAEQADRADEFKDLRKEASKRTEDEFVKKVGDRSFWDSGVEMDEQSARQTYRNIKAGATDQQVKDQLGRSKELELKMNTIEERANRTMNSPNADADILKKIDDLAADLEGADVQPYMKDPIRKRLAETQKKVISRRNVEVKPQSATKSQDAVQAKTVETSMAPRPSQEKASAGTTLNNVNSVNNHRTVVRVDPRSSQPAYGINPQRGYV